MTARPPDRGERPRPGPRPLAGDAPGQGAQGRPGAARPFETISGIAIRDLYTPADTAGLDEDRDLGRPGEFPFTRGVQPTMYRGRFWTMRQYAGFATAEETNERFRYLLEQGQTGLSVAFDLPTQMGYDSDAPEAEGEVGRVGVPISSLADMEILLDGLPLGEVSTSMTINATAPILLALYVAAAEAQGVPRAAIGGHDPERHPQGVHRARHLHLPAAAVDAPGDRHLRVLRRRAAPLEHDLDLGLPHARGRGDRGPGAGLHPGRRDRLRRGGRRPRPRRRRLRRPPVASSSPPGRELFEEVAKFRVARRMWATIMRERFGAKDPRSMMCRFHVQTAGSSLTAQSVDNNVVRTTVQALAAVLGGAQSLHTNSRDEALALPTEEAARLALRTQQILAYEAGVTETPDPLGGLLLRRDPDQRARGGRLGLPRRDRGDGRHARGHRGRLPAAPDPGGRLPRPAGDRVGRPGRRRGQPVPRRRGARRRRSSGSTRTASAARSSGVRRVRAERSAAGLGRGHGPRSRRPPAATAT